LSFESQYILLHELVINSNLGFRLAPNSMTLNDIERQNAFLWIFWRFWAATQVYIIHKEAPRYYHYVHFGMTVIKVL